MVYLSEQKLQDDVISASGGKQRQIANMTNSQSKFRSGITAFLTLVVFAGMVGVYLDLDRAIQQGNVAHLRQRLILWIVLMSFPSMITCLPTRILGPISY